MWWLRRNVVLRLRTRHFEVAERKRRADGNGWAQSKTTCHRNRCFEEKYIPYTTFAACNHLESLREYFAQTSCRINTTASVKTNELEFRRYHTNSYQLRTQFTYNWSTTTQPDLDHLFTLKVKITWHCTITADQNIVWYTLILDQWHFTVGGAS